MARVLFWNVEHFSADKFFNAKRKRRRDDEGDWGVSPALSRRWVLRTVLAQHAVDFIVILELQTGPGAQRMQPLADNGAWRLLRILRGYNVNWSLVPPLTVGSGGRAEGIAFYYRRDRYHFTGPWVFPGGNGPAAAGGVPGYYPEPWCQYDNLHNPDPTDMDNALPNRVIPAAAGNLHNGGLNENQVAMQPRFYLNGAPRVFGVANGRHPCRATFYDAANDHNYTLVAFHAPPGQNTLNPALGDSVLGTQTLANLPEIQGAPALNETIIVVGDFNISLFDGVAVAAGYGPMTAAGYQQVVVAGGGFAATYPGKGYLTTHIKPVGDVINQAATPSDVNGYPAFGYGSAQDLFGTYDSIDNGFARFGGGGAVANATVANIVVGSPYNIGGVVPPMGAPIGHYAFASEMSNLTALNLPHGRDPNGQFFDHWVSDFIDFDNYQRVRAVSDHMALIFDV